MYTLCNTMGPQTNIHHLSANIPNYCLAECHDQYQDLFSSVTRVRLGEVRDALKCILWTPVRTGSFPWLNTAS